MHQPKKEQEHFSLLMDSNKQNVNFPQYAGHMSYI